MVHPTPALINPLAFGIGHAGPAAVWCTRTRRFRPLTKPADADADLEQAARASTASTSAGGRASTSAAGAGAGAGGKARTPLQQWTGNKASQQYTPTSIVAQRQKQLNNMTPVVPHPPIAKSTTTPTPTPTTTTAGQTRSSVPAPTVWWNDHLRMI